VEEVGDRIPENLGQVVVTAQDLRRFLGSRQLCLGGSSDHAAHVDTDLCSFRTFSAVEVEPFPSAWLPQFTVKPGTEATEDGAIMIAAERLRRSRWGEQFASARTRRRRDFRVTETQPHS
jgi:hypothetical protein